MTFSRAALIVFAVGFLLVVSTLHLGDPALPRCPKASQRIVECRP